MKSSAGTGVPIADLSIGSLSAVLCIKRLASGNGLRPDFLAVRVMTRLRSPRVYHLPASAGFVSEPHQRSKSEAT